MAPPAQSKAPPAERRRLRREVARSVDAPACLLPVFARLFQDMPSLGSSPRRVVGMLERAGIGPRSHILDLACGKGTVAIAAARRLGCAAIGVDACEAFTKEAAASATRAHVADRVAFVTDDVRAFARRAPRSKPAYNAALMVGLLGLEEARDLLRPLVKPGGLYLIDDVFRDQRRTRQRPEFAEIPTREESRAMLERDGDRVVDVHIDSPARLHALNTSLYRSLAANAREVARVRPGLRAPLATFLANQRHANRLLGRELRPAVWLVRRA